MFADPLRSELLGYCRYCGSRVSTHSYRDLQSLREGKIAFSCQGCLDMLSLAEDEGNPSVSHRIRHGVVVGAVTEDECLHEVALLPFVFVVPPRRLVWEPRFILRAGVAAHPVDPWVELDGMRVSWADHNAGVLCVPSFAHSLLRGALTRRDLVLGFDETSLRVAAQLCPTAKPTALVSVSAELPWRDAYGTPLLPLAPFLYAHALDTAFGTADACAASALRQCALLAGLLTLRATTGRDAGRSAFDLLLLAHGARFEESFRREASETV